MSARPLLHLLAACAAVLVLLVGCGEEFSEPNGNAGISDDSGSAADSTGSADSPDSDSPSTPAEPASSSTAPASDLPGCDEVWVGGAVLPADYQGCFDGSAEVLPDPLSCSSGQKIVTYDPFWAVPGAKVQETNGLDTDPAFATVKNQCQA